MGKLKILLLSTALAAFGAGAVLAQPVQYAATTGETKAKTKKTKKVATKKTTNKKALKTKKTTKKKSVAAKPKKKPAPSNDTEAAPGNPPPGNSTN